MAASSALEKKRMDIEKRTRITSNLELLRTVDDMSVNHLKKLIKKLDLDTRGCVEKNDLKKKAREGKVSLTFCFGLICDVI